MKHDRELLASSDSETPESGEGGGYRTQFAVEIVPSSPCVFRIRLCRSGRCLSMLLRSGPRLGSDEC